MKTKVLLYLILVSFLVKPFTGSAQAINTQDSLALVEFYDSTNGAGWRSDSNWLTKAPVSTWYGVTVQTDRVTKLLLPGNNLAGGIPPSIGDLSNLTSLYLISNQLTGNIPSALGNLTKLDTLSLGGNGLNGDIPFSLGNLINLTFLNLRINKLSGNIPFSLANLKKLTVLDLKNNSLEGPIPDSLSSLTNLTALRLQNNQFTFAGMENIAKNYAFAEYSPQAIIKINRVGNSLSATAGGTLSNNTFNWFRNGTLFSTKKGDSTLNINDNSGYSVSITNAIANQLTLSSYIDTVPAEALIAMTPDSATQNISGTAPIDINDHLHSRMLTITPASGANALNGEVECSVAIDTAVSTYNNQPYVQRHYDITPSANASTAQATVTLYFTQGDFDNFNAYVTAHNLDIPLLPAGGVDNGNVRVIQLHGEYTTSSDPGNYKDSSVVLITPAVSWDNTNNWWEVTFPVSGFSGFFISTLNITLPLTLVEFTGKPQNNAAHLRWLTNNEVNTKQFLVQRSKDGATFNSIGSVQAQSSAGSHTYYFNDTKVLTGNNFYRLQMSDNDGRVTYSNIITVKTNNNNPSLSVYPNPAKNNATLLFNATTQSRYEIKITDVSGKVIKNINGASVIGENKINLDLNNYGRGTYYLILHNNETGTSALKLSKQ